MEADDEKAGSVGAGVSPPPVLRADLASFTGAGYGVLRIPAGVHLEPGQIVAVTDDEADMLTAEVLAVGEARANVRVHWNHDNSAP
ncbi:hypothetical protein ASC64_17600 [Nocardioides sp. Root122]|uniref:hypothetical protein n=1 Tax=Nocardioides TaxID=1839 RepID=UPI000702D985|nr:MULTISPECIES: hypothetical protein [Nocardioides]KQV63401.1 hypothetical protein ASC64_17600 [Nocardioides sp. Root122]MCK9826065.1 hypothetical protein [Nocardioides cavernae]